MEPSKKKIGYVIGSIITLLTVFGGGVFLGYSNRPFQERITSLTNKEAEAVTVGDFAPFWKVWSIINQKYVDPNKVTDQEKVWGAVQGLVGSLNDPYSVFLAPKENKEFQEVISGAFGGIGIEIGMKEGILTVIAPIKDTPAEKAGMKAGDRILKINDTITSDLTIDKAIDMIRGEIGTKITLTVLPEKSTTQKTVELTRATIEIPTLDTEQLENGIFMIRLYNFSVHSSELFAQALQEFNTSGSTKLIIDLRNNPGGFLESAVQIGGWFLPNGKVIVQEKTRDDKNDTMFRSQGPGLFANTPIVVLVNQGSASASEILAGALQEHGKATLVGERTYGKGSVQELIPVTKDTSIKITIAKWLTPNGISISENGLKPDVQISITENDIKNKLDPQIIKAKEILNR